MCALHIPLWYCGCVFPFLFTTVFESCITISTVFASFYFSLVLCLRQGFVEGSDVPTATVVSSALAHKLFSG